MPVLWLVDTRAVYHRVFNIYVPIGLGVLALFTVTIIGAVFVFRQRPGVRRGRLRRASEANLLEGGYAVVLLCIAVVLLYITFGAEHKDDAIGDERAAVTVDVTASRWEWSFFYPKGRVTHTSGAVGDQPLVVPVNEPVRFNLRSADVIHSFWIPELAFKRDAIPGSVQRITLDFDKTGTFSGSCSEYCGVLHSEMVFSVRVVSDSAFRGWLAGRGSSPV